MDKHTCIQGKKEFIADICYIRSCFEHIICRKFLRLAFPLKYHKPLYDVDEPHPLHLHHLIFHPSFYHIYEVFHLQSKNDIL